MYRLVGSFACRAATRLPAPPGRGVRLEERQRYESGLQRAPGLSHPCLVHVAQQALGGVTAAAAKAGASASPARARHASVR